MDRKEAIEIVRKLYNESLFMKKDKEAMVTLIPELKESLKESEGDRIRKELINLVKSYSEFYGNTWKVGDFTEEQVLAWLEKQGEHANFLSKIQVGDKVTRNDNGELVNLSQLERVAKKDNHTKEGVKAPLVSDTDTAFINDIKNIINEAPGVFRSDKNKLIAWLEKKGEQKPADKVESKFKAGDWITIKQ